MRNRKLQMLCEGAILVALAQILSMLKLWEMPWGGSITLGMLPIFLFAVRWGTRWGLVAGFAYGLLQVMFDGGFAISWQSILGDYLVAFTVLGLAGLGRGREKGIFLGTVLGGAARFVVHWVVGATVWAMYMPDAFFGMTMTSPWLYSLLYNGYSVSPYYDSLVAKVIVHAPTRLEAIRRMRRCLEEFTLEGFPTNAELSYELLFHPTFVRGGCTTAFLDRSLPELLEFSRRIDDHKG